MRRRAEPSGAEPSGVEACSGRVPGASQRSPPAFWRPRGPRMAPSFRTSSSLGQTVGADSPARTPTAPTLRRRGCSPSARLRASTPASSGTGNARLPLVDDQRAPKPSVREREKLEVVGDTQQPPRDPERDELAVGELRRTPRPPKVWGRGGHRSAHTVRQRGVEGVWREGLQGRRCDSNASLRRPPHRPIWHCLVRLLIGALSVPADDFVSTRLSGSLASVWGWLPLTRCGLGRRRARGRYGAGLAWCGRERRAAVEVQRCRPGFVSASAAPATSSSTMAAAGRTSLTMPALCPA
jgi:hypothetical protein